MHSAALIVTALCAALRGIAVQAQEGEVAPDDCIIIYLHIDQNVGSEDGEQMEVCKSIPDLEAVSPNLNDAVSSAVYGANIYSVVFFDEANYQGNHLESNESILDFVGVSFNDMASSIHLNFRSLDEAPDAECIRLFSETTHTGVATELCQDAPDLAVFGFDNTASSISLGESVSAATVFDLADYTGRSYIVREDVEDLDADLRFEAQISSIRISVDTNTRFDEANTCADVADGTFECPAGSDCNVVCAPGACIGCRIIGPESPFNLAVTCEGSGNAAEGASCRDLIVERATTVSCGPSACSMADVTCTDDQACAMGCEGPVACFGATVMCPEYAGCSVACNGDATTCENIFVDQQGHLPFQYVAANSLGDCAAHNETTGWCSRYSCGQDEWQCPPVLTSETKCVAEADECPVTSCKWPDSGCDGECRRLNQTDTQVLCEAETDDVFGVCDSGFEHCLTRVGQGEQVGCPWDFCIGQAGVCKDLTNDVCEDALDSYGNCASGYIHCDTYDGGPHHLAVDACPAEGMDFTDECLSKLQFAAVQCCDVNATGCTAYCSEGEFATYTLLATFEEAERFCSDQGQRLCATPEELSGCCDSACSRNGQLAFISETCETDNVPPGLPPAPEMTAIPIPAPAPTLAPSPEPTLAPTPEPTLVPTSEPTSAPTPEPTSAPTPEPTSAPTPEPTSTPTTMPTPPPAVEGFNFLVKIVPDEPILNVNSENAYTISSRVVPVDESAPPPEASVRRQWLALTKLGAKGSDDDEVIDLETTAGVLLTPSTGARVKVARGVLEPGSEYEVTLAYFRNLQPDGPRGFAVNRFRTNAPPFGGQCSVSPTEGMALSTNFSFECNGWRDDSGGPLEYRFSLVAVDTSDTEVRALSRFRSSLTHDAVLASPNVVADGVWQAFGSVRDEFGAAAVYDIGRISVSSPLGPMISPPTGAEVRQFARQSIDTTLTSVVVDGDVDETLNIVGSVAQILNAASDLEGPTATGDAGAAALEASMARHELFRVAIDASPANSDTGERRNDDIEIALQSVQPLLGTASEVSIDLRDDASFYLINSASEAVRGERSNAGISDSLSQASLAMLSTISRVQEPQAEALTTRLLSHPRHSNALQSLRHPEHVRAQARRRQRHRGDGPLLQNAVDGSMASAESYQREGVLQGAVDVASASAGLLQTDPDMSGTSNSRFNAERTFSRDFDWTVYLLSRGTLRTKIAEEAPTIVEADDITLVVSKEFTSEYTRTFNASGAAVTFPDALFNATTDPNVVDFSMLVYRGTSLQEEFVSFYGQSSSVLTAHELEWEDYVDAVARLDSVSSLVRAEFYDAEAEIQADASEQAQVQVSGVGVSGVGTDDTQPCDESGADRIAIVIPLQARVAELLKNDSTAVPVCRHLDEDQLRFRSDCELDEQHLADSGYTEARCVCSHLTFFDVGWGDFVPRPSRIRRSTIEQVTLANISDYPQGGYTLLTVLVTYMLMFLFAWWVDKRYMAQYRQRAKETFQKFVLFTDSELLSPYIDDPRLPRVPKIKAVFWRMMGNYHKWVAIFLRDPRSNYLTRDRVTVVFAYVMSSFAISAIFYRSQRDNFANYVGLGVVISLTSGVPSYVFKYLYSRTQSSKSQSRLGTHDTVPSFVPDDDMPSLRRMLSTTFRSSFKSSVELIGKGAASGSRRMLPRAFSQRVLQRNATLTYTSAAQTADDSVVTADGVDADFENADRTLPVVDLENADRTVSVAEKRSLDPLPEHKDGDEDALPERKDGDLDDDEAKLPEIRQAHNSFASSRRKSELRPRLSQSASALADIDVESPEIDAELYSFASSRRKSELSNPRLSQSASARANYDITSKSKREISLSISKSVTNEGEPLNTCRTGDLQPAREEAPPSSSGDTSPADDPRRSAQKPDPSRSSHGGGGALEPSLSAASIGSIHDVDGRKSAIVPRNDGSGEPLEITQMRLPRTERTKPLWHPRVKSLILFFVFLWTVLCAFTVLLLSLDFDLPEPVMLGTDEFYAAFRCPGVGGDVDVDASAENGGALEGADGSRSTATQWLFSALIASAIDIFISQPLWLMLNSVYRVLRFERTQQKAKRSTLRELSRSGVSDDVGTPI